jgi:hypothetical protein
MCQYLRIFCLFLQHSDLRKSMKAETFEHAVMVMMNGEA